MGELRAGDRVELVGEIMGHDGNGGLWVDFSVDARSVTWPTSSVPTAQVRLPESVIRAGKLLPRPSLAVGDKVKTRCGYTPGIIRAISPDGSAAWVQSLDNTQWNTVNLDKLERSP